MTLASMLVTLQTRLGDTASVIWPQTELESYIQEGYDELCRRTGCLWATDVLPDVPAFATTSQAWEQAYTAAGQLSGGHAAFTADFERDWAEGNVRGPANHNFVWEFDDGHVTVTLDAALVDIPDDLNDIERSTWNTIALMPLRSSDLEGPDQRYERTQGQVEGYLLDKDGWNTFRKWRVPSAAYDPYALDDSNKIWGILRSVSDITGDVPVDHWGDITQVQDHTDTEEWGIVRAIYKEPNAVRIEYRRKPVDLSLNQDFEIQDRYTVYVRHYAHARALEHEGKGQELELAAHYQQRYEEGVARILKRKQTMSYQKLAIMGAGPKTPYRPRPSMGWPYPAIPRY